MKFASKNEKGKYPGFVSESKVLVGFERLKFIRNRNLRENFANLYTIGGKIIKLKVLFIST